MTIATTTSRVVAQGNGATTAFSYNFLIPSSDDLVVTYTDANGISTQLASSQYSVSGLGNVGGGTVTYPVSGSPIASGTWIAIQRILPFKQLTKLTNQGNYFPQVVEGALDSLEMQIQQLAEGNTRALQFPPSDPLTVSSALPSVAQRAGMVLTFDAYGNPIAVAPDTGSATALAMQLANYASPSQGAGQLGFLASLTYGANTVGAFLANLVSSAGAASVGFLHTITGAIARTMSDKATDTVSLFDFMTFTQIGSVRLGNLSVDVTTPVQTAVNNARGRRILAPQGRYKLTAPIVINTLVSGAATPFIMQGEGYDANNGTKGTSFCNYSGTTDCFQVANTGDVDTKVVLEDFGVYGLGGFVATAGNGITVTNSANTRIKRVWVQGHGNVGVYFYQCYGSSIEDSYVNGNRIFGIQANQAFNTGTIRRCKVYGNGFVWSQATANIAIGGAGNPNLGVTIDGPTDVSYAGNALSWYCITPTGVNVALNSIVVAGGVATATTPAAHGRTTGDRIYVTGASVQPTLNSVYQSSITVTGANTFTWATSAPNGTYTEATLQIGPDARGIQISSTNGLLLNAYCENSASIAAYIGSDVSAFEMKGGYWLGSAGSGTILLDNCSNGKLGAMEIAGSWAGIVLAQTTRQHGVDVQSSVVLASGAATSLSTVYMIDGEYYSNAMPTTGSWTKGVTVNNNSAAATVTPAWYRLTTGSGNVLNTDWRAFPVL